MATKYQELQSKISGELVGVSAARSGNSEFLLVQESNLVEMPLGAFARLQAVSFSKLEAGDFILLSTDGKVTARRFVRLSVANGITRLVVADGMDREESHPFPRLLGLVCGVRTSGPPYNPNPNGFIQRAAFKIRHKWATRQHQAA